MGAVPGDDPVAPDYDPDTANEALAPASRTGTPRSLFWFWTASGVTIAVAPSGILIATTAQLSLVEALLALLVGFAISGSVLAVISSAGQRTGLATLALSRSLFGRRGNVGPLLLSFVILMGWCAISTVLLVYCVDAVLQRFGVRIDDTTRASILVVFAVVLVLLVWAGYRFIEASQVWIAGIVGAASVALGIYAATQVQWGSVLAERPGGVVPFTAAVVIALTTAASGWWNAGADFSRFLSPRYATSAMARATLAGMVGAFAMVLLGMVLAYWDPVAARSANPLAAVTEEFPLPVALLWLVVVAVGLHAAAVTNSYSAVLNLNELGLRRRSVAVAVSAGMTIGLSWWIVFDDAGFYEWFSSFLTVLGVPLAAWAGVFVVGVLRYRAWPADRRGFAVWPLVWVGLASAVGLGLVQSETTGLAWVGYLAPTAELTAAGVGVLVALLVALIGQWCTASRTWGPPGRG